MNRRFVIFAYVALALGCAVKAPDGKQVRRDWPQKCEMCGAEWLVTPVSPKETVPPTVEWCFNDGGYCDVGIDMMIDASKNGETPDREQRWLSHCSECKGCRCAAFDPEEWAKAKKRNPEVAKAL